MASEDLLAEPTEGGARNAPCPCGSGSKRKHCCGRERRWLKGRDARATLRQGARWR